MGTPRALSVVITFALLPAWFASPVAAADKTSLACIRAAEDGQAARARGELLHARELFAVCAARECPAILRRDCTAWVEDASRETPSVVVVARDTAGRDLSGAQLSLDGTSGESPLDGSAIELDPGPHVVRVKIAGSDPIEERILLAAGEKNRTINVTFSSPHAAVAVPAAPPAPPSVAPAGKGAPSSALSPHEVPSRGGLPSASYVFGGLGIAALGVFGYFGVRGMLDADHLRSTCVPACQEADVDAVHTKLVVADVALGVGILSLAAATLFGVRALTAASRVGGASSGVVFSF